MRCPTSWPTLPAWWASIRSLGSWIISSGRRLDALRLLVARVRRLAAQRAGRRYGAVMGVRAAAGPSERAAGLRPHVDRGAQPQRHQGAHGPLAGRVEHGG